MKIVLEIARYWQILALEDEVEDPDDDSQWDGSKLTNRETVGPW